MAKWGTEQNVDRIVINQIEDWVGVKVGHETTKWNLKEGVALNYWADTNYG